MKYFILFFNLVLLLGFNLKAQITLNEVDSSGLKQGMWKEFKIPYNIVTENIGIKVPKITSEYYFLTKDKHRKYFPIIECIGEYNNSMKTGIWTEYYSNGNFKSQIEYKNGIPMGLCKMYWENGVLKMDCIITSASCFPIKIYNEDGSLLSEQMGLKKEVLKSIYEN